MSPPIRLLIADHEPTRLGIRLALEDEIEVCAEAADALEATDAASRTRPDVGIVGIELPGGALDAIRAIVDVAPRTAVLVLASKPNPSDLLAITRAGALGYVPARLESAQLRRVIEAAALGEAVVPRALVHELMRELQEVPRGPAGGGLTDREARVLRMLRRGSSTAAVARDLGISPVTVRRHVSGLKRKLAVEDREELIGPHDLA